ncbi:MAG: DUF6261 family protein [Bacteroidales bacterium]|jgi:hypothetical protein|nr:DUF6261 family protein [Bacteroidales bacterium]
MKIKINRIPYKQLWNNEFPVMYGQVITIGKRYDMVSLHLEKSWNALIAFEATMESFGVYVRKNEKLTLAGKLDAERDMLIMLVRRVTDAFEAGVVFPEIGPHYEALSKLLDKHQARTIARDSRSAETERLLLLEKDLQGNEVAREALAAFGLKPVAERLFDANREYEATFNEYIDQKSSEIYFDMVQARKDCTDALNRFFDALQYCSEEYENVDYQPAANAFNLLNDYYTRHLKARASRRSKNSDKAEEEAPIEPMPEVKINN